MTTDNIANKALAFQLKGSLFTLTVMHLKTANIESISNQLSATVKDSPKFFQRAPLVLDISALSGLDLEMSVDFAALADVLKHHHLIPVGIRGGNDQQRDDAAEAGFALFPNTKSESSKKANKSSANNTAPAHVITAPVRSGQQIYAKNADLIVINSVSHGAELLADGHIHVYGALRGRALAGVTGNTEARIFCQSLEAELISIAGRYIVNEHITALPDDTHMVQIYLEDGHLRFNPL